MRWKSRHPVTHVDGNSITVKVPRGWRIWRKHPIRTITITPADGNFKAGTRVIWRQDE